MVTVDELRAMIREVIREEMPISTKCSCMTVLGSQPDNLFLARVDL